VIASYSHIGKLANLSVKRVSLNCGGVYQSIVNVRTMTLRIPGGILDTMMWLPNQELISAVRCSTEGKGNEQCPGKRKETARSSGKIGFP
jgi:hypothetical protein